jgi:hypothetical protein
MEVAALYALFDAHGITYHELCGIEVWRGWGRCSQVDTFTLPVKSSETHQSHRSLRPLIVALIPGQQRSLDKLKTTRLRLANEVAAVINEFGPKLYDDFDEVFFST